MRRHGKVLLAALTLLIAIGAATAVADTAPTPTISTPTNVQYSTAHLAGEVNPNGGPSITHWRFEWSTDQSNWTQGQDHELSEEQSKESTPIPVEEDLSGIEPNTTYFVRLAASNEGGENQSGESTFKTLAAAPIVATASTISRSDGSAPLDSLSLSGFVNPRKAAIADCHFAYGRTESYGQTLPCEPMPTAGNEPEEVHAKLSGLTAGATYHFQLEATSAGGSAHTEDAVFTAPEAPASESCPNEAVRVEQHSTFLPNCRAYEQVSPASKNGADVLSYSGSTRASTDGEAVSYASLTAFGDAHGTGVTSEYLARRGSSGWDTHSISPVTGSGNFGAVATGISTYYAQESPDLSHGVIYGLRPLTDSPPVKGTLNLYMRDDLLSAGAGHYQLLTPCLLCEEEEPEGSLPPLTGSPSVDAFATVAFAEASPDSEHGAFESVRNLTPDAPEQPEFCALLPTHPVFCAPRLYEWDHGVMRLAGILPSGEAADGSFDGQEGALMAQRSPHVVSDGSDGHTRIEFTQPTDSEGHTVSQLGPFGAAALYGINEGNLFQRIDGAETIQLNASERTPCLAEPESCVGEFAPATYLDASVNGERIFFMSRQALTNDAPLNTDEKIYMYDASKPTSDPHNLTLLTPDDEPADDANARGIVGTSEDGKYVYMVVTHQLLRGHPISITSLYLWHEGQITEVAPITSGSMVEVLLGNTPYTLRQHQARVSPDGLHLLFGTTGRGFGEGQVGPTGYDQGECFTSLGLGCREIYSYDATTNQLRCVSCNPSGAPAQSLGGTGAEVGENMASVFAEANNVHPATTYLNRALSAGGRYVFFDSVEALVPGDTNGVTDAYEYDIQTGQVHLLSSGTSTEPSYVLEGSKNGRDAFITTRQRLVGTDTDKAYDLYDVRIGGGFPEPPPGPAECKGETCQGSQATPPAPPTIGSGLLGAGNQRPHRRHRHHHRRHHHHRHSGSRRRVGK